jgi:molecular chaperone GrpE (heat shock protein)
MYFQSFCKDLLDVADVLHRAVSAGCSNNDAVNKDMFEGLRLTENQLLQVSI